MPSKSSTNLSVVAFGNKVVSDHRSNQTRLTTIFQPSDVLATEKSLGIKTQADLTIASLSGLKDKSFDVAYLDNQISFDQTVLDEIDADYPFIINADFKTLMMNTRESVQKNWEDAKVLRDTMKP